MTYRLRASMHALLAASIVVTATAGAQSTDRAGAPASPELSSWWARVSVTGFTGQFRPRGDSEAFRLFDQALTRGTSSLTPQLPGGGVQVRVWRHASVVADLSAGQRTIESFSRATATNSYLPVPQQTRFDVRGMQSLGVQWQAWSWRRSAAHRPWMTLSAGAGAGRVNYTLRQWGDFVDASRQLRFSDDLRSNGRGSFTYLTGVAEVPVTRWAALRVDLRRQYGSAGMNGDYSSFDALDLSGTRIGAGLTLNVAGFSGRR